MQYCSNRLYLLKGARVKRPKRVGGVEVVGCFGGGESSKSRSEAKFLYCQRLLALELESNYLANSLKLDSVRCMLDRSEPVCSNPGELTTASQLDRL